MCCPGIRDSGRWAGNDVNVVLPANCRCAMFIGGCRLRDIDMGQGGWNPVCAQRLTATGLERVSSGGNTSPVLCEAGNPASACAAASAPMVMRCIAAHPVAVHSILATLSLQLYIARQLGRCEQFPGANMGGEVCMPE